MKKAIVIFLIITMYVLFRLLTISDDNQVKISQDILHRYEIPSKVDISTSMQFFDEEALIDLGKHVGHMNSPISGTSCFGSCHNVSLGGHPVSPLPSGGGFGRQIASKLNDKYKISSTTLPFDTPVKDSPGFADGFADSLILWEGVPSEFVFEEQGRRGTDAHDMDGLFLQSENDIISRFLYERAYGTDTMSVEGMICAIAAYEQTVVTNESNIARGIVTRPEGLALFDQYCQDCHTSGALNPSVVDNPIHDPVKTPRLTAWVFSPCDFHNCEELPLFQNRTWNVIKKHKPIYPELDTLTFQDALKIESFIKRDLTDYNLERYK